MTAKTRPLKTLFTTCLILATALASTAYGQVNMRLDLKRHSYLKYEPIQPKLTLYNHSGNTLTFNNNKGRIYFDITRGHAEQHVSEKRRGTNFGRGLTLAPGDRKVLKVTLNNYYNLTREGDYRIRARLTHSRLSHDMLSEDASIFVGSGSVLWQQRFGVPSGGDAKKQIASRKATLLAFQHGENREKYALRVEDEDLVYTVQRLGRRIGGRDAEYRIDALSHIHILFPISAKLFRYYVFDYNGKLKQSKYVMVSGDVPHLYRKNGLGTVEIRGGERAYPGIDFKVREQSGPRRRRPRR